MDRPLGSARRYAAALLSLAGEGGAAEALVAELDRVAEVVNTPGARTILDDPRTPPAARVGALEAATGATVSPAVHTLMGALASRRKLGRLPAIAEATHEALDARNGIATARVSTPSEIGADERSSWRSSFSFTSCAINCQRRAQIGVISWLHRWCDWFFVCNYWWLP